MKALEDVLRGIETCKSGKCTGADGKKCPYFINNPGCITEMLIDADEVIDGALREIRRLRTQAQREGKVRRL